jgi:hypothetical protein
VPQATHRTIARKSYWIDIDEAASLLSAQPEGVLSLVRDGILAGRGGGDQEIAVLAAEVKRLARALSPPLPRRGACPAGSRRACVAVCPSDQPKKRPAKRRRRRSDPGASGACGHCVA